jgi:hypothetical protein
MGTKSNAKRKRRRERLWGSQGGLCHWCGKPMRHWNDCPEVTTNVRPLPADLATIDHLRDRFDPTRGERTRNGEQRWVLAHQKCNQERGRKREVEFGKRAPRRAAVSRGQRRAA